MAYSGVARLVQAKNKGMKPLTNAELKAASMRGTDKKPEKKEKK